MDTNDSIFLTTDGGRTYQYVWDSREYWSAFYRHPADPDIVLVQDLYSDDGGRTWTERFEAFLGFSVPPGNSDIMYGIERADQQGEEGTEYWFNLSVSTDRGSSFRFVGSFGNTSEELQPRVHMAVDAGNGDVVYAVVFGSSAGAAARAR